MDLSLSEFSSAFEETLRARTRKKEKRVRGASIDAAITVLSAGKHDRNASLLKRKQRKIAGEGRPEQRTASHARGAGRRSIFEGLRAHDTRKSPELTHNTR